jgi:hypothetical protein
MFFCTSKELIWCNPNCYIKLFFMIKPQSELEKIYSELFANLTTL